MRQLSCAIFWFAKTSKTEICEINVDIFLWLHCILFFPSRQRVIYQEIFFFYVAVSTLVWLILLEKGHYCHIMSCFPVPVPVLRCLCFARPIGAHIYSNGSLCLLTCVDTSTNISMWPYFFFYVLSFVDNQKNISIYAKAFFFIDFLLVKNEERLWN